jgi:hypothetical protein
MEAQQGGFGLPQIFFKKQYFAAIREGTKRTTIRRWPKARISAGSDVYAPHIGWLKIEGVEQVTLKELGDADARADGFESRESMLRALHELYPDHRTDGKQWFRVLFRIKELIQPRTRGEPPQMSMF